MGVFVGLDVGTTSLSAVALDTEAERILAQATLPNSAAVSSTGPQGHLYAELDLSALGELLIALLARLAEQIPGEAVAAIGVTGQQHGLALLSSSLAPVDRAITWQDQRAQERVPDSSETYLQAMIREAGGAEAFEATGCLPAPGFAGVSLYWLLRQGRLPAQAAHACLIPDAAVSLLTGAPPCSDPTDAGSTGLFDVVAGDWAWPLIERLGLPRTLFPAVRSAGLPHAPLASEAAARCGLGPVPVCVAAGDNQASFLGSVQEPDRSVLVNVGTGGQVSAVVDRFLRLPEIETRAYFGGRYLLVGAGLYGGRAYAYLQEFFRQVGAALFEADPAADLYDRMNELASRVPPGCDGLRWEPLFTGTRTDPSRRASLTGIGPTNLTPGHLARALLEGLAEGFWALYRRMAPTLGPRPRLVGAGNGLTRNPVLAEIVARRFGQHLYLAPETEAAALGAAMLACVGSGERTLTSVSALVTCDRVVPAAPEAREGHGR